MINLSLLSILNNCFTEKQIKNQELEQLLALELSNQKQTQAWKINANNGLDKLKIRANLFQTIYPEVKQICANFGLNHEMQIITTLWNLWLPWTLQLATERETLGRTLIQGILGVQGTGKTTLTTITQRILAHLGYSSLNLSLDDLYKTYAERQQLQQEDPRLIWRGPPGTHDVNLGIKILDQLRYGSESELILIPRFDKSAYNGAGDRTKFEPIHKADIVLFEGWFVGVRPIAQTAFENLPEPILTATERQFAQDCNQRLQAYLPLWQRLDRLMVLVPIDYRLSKQWRKEAEAKMMASGKMGMNETEIEAFVEYFWRSLHPELFITPLLTNSDLVNLVIEINPDHTLSQVYKPY